MTTRKEAVLDVVKHCDTMRERLQEVIESLEHIDHQDDGDSISRNEIGAMEADPQDVETLAQAIIDLYAATDEGEKAVETIDGHFWFISY